MAYLPLELVLLIAEALIPGPQAIVPPSHDLTRTLVSLARVCKALHAPASRLLQRHCVYIDSPQRARLFVQYLSSTHPGRHHHIESLYLAPVPETYDRHDPEWLKHLEQVAQTIPASEQPDSPNSEGSSALWDMRPEAPQLRRTEETLYPKLSRYKFPIANLTVAMATRDLLLLLAPTLKRLIVDLDIVLLGYGKDPKGIKPVLRQGLGALVHLEECVSIRDELDLDLGDGSRDTLVWAVHWPKLRRLAIRPCAIFHNEPDFWNAMAALPEFDTILFMSVLSSPNRTEDVKTMWLDAVADVTGRPMADVQSNPRPLTAVHVDDISERKIWYWPVTAWRELDPTNRIRVLEARIRTVRSGHCASAWDIASDDEYAAHKSHYLTCMDKVRELALQGILWDATVRDSYDPCAG